jgi:hypothetical protein
MAPMSALAAKIGNSVAIATIPVWFAWRSDRLAVGTRINQAHQDPNIPLELELRRNVIRRIAHDLERHYRKEVVMEFRRRGPGIRPSGSAPHLRHLCLIQKLTRVHFTPSRCASTCLANAAHLATAHESRCSIS